MLLKCSIIGLCGSVKRSGALRVKLPCLYYRGCMGFVVRSMGVIRAGFDGEALTVPVLSSV